MSLFVCREYFKTHFKKKEVPEVKTKEQLWKRWMEEAGGRLDTWSAGGRRGRVQGKEEAAGTQRRESLGLRQEVARVRTMACTEQSQR